VVQTLEAAGHQAFLVGGCVRDLLRGVRAKDFDLASSARPEATLALFPKTVATGIQHGTVTVVEPEGHVEVTTFRGEEGYQDGRRPDRVFFLDDIQGDLARRDFTVNAIAFDPHRRLLVDPYGGVADLSRRLLRCVGEADSRFGEDGLRPLRAVRFASVLRFEIDPPTLAAIPRALPVYARVAIERVADELRKLLLGPRPSRGLALLVETGLADRIFPALADEPPDDRAHRFRRVDLTPPIQALRLAALFAGHIGAVDTLRLSNGLRDRVALLERFSPPLEPLMGDADLRRFASAVGRAPLRQALVLQRAELKARGGEAALSAFFATRTRLRNLLAQAPPLTVGELAIQGTELTRILGGPGPHVGRALRRLLDVVLEQPELNSREALLPFLPERKP
jgi:tRNA nucleotidyltransferase (CCA-adding enzyme)